MSTCEACGTEITNFYRVDVELTPNVLSSLIVGKRCADKFRGEGWTIEALSEEPR